MNAGRRAVRRRARHAHRAGGAGAGGAGALARGGNPAAHRRAVPAGSAAPGCVSRPSRNGNVSRGWQPRARRDTRRPVPRGSARMSSIVHPVLAHGRRLPNAWDLAALLAVFAAIAAVAHVTPGTFKPIAAPDALAVSLDPARLPEYALRTTMRMFAALAASLLFTFTYAPLAAKSRRAGLVMIPILDVLQSVPILGFLSFTTVFFMSLFPGRVLGLELAAIFAIFTSQAWNMAFSLYQSLTTVPRDLEEATRSFRLTAWQRFWRLDVPFAHAGAGVEHHAVDVRRLVLRGRLGGDHARRQDLDAARHRLLRRDGARQQRDLAAVGLGDPGDARGDRAVRPVAVPPAGRMVGEIPLRDRRRRGRRGPVGAEAAAAHAGAAARRPTALADALRRDHAAADRAPDRPGGWRRRRRHAGRRCGVLRDRGRWWRCGGVAAGRLHRRQQHRLERSRRDGRCSAASRCCAWWC